MVLCGQVTASVIAGICADIVALLRLMWDDVGRLVADAAQHKALDCFFQHAFQEVSLTGADAVARAPLRRSRPQG